jgi:hypothetical protein
MLLPLCAAALGRLINKQLRLVNRCVAYPIGLVLSCLRP